MVAIGKQDFTLCHNNSFSSTWQFWSLVRQLGAREIHNRVHMSFGYRKPHLTNSRWEIIIDVATKEMQLRPEEWKLDFYQIKPRCTRCFFAKALVSPISLKRIPVLCTQRLAGSDLSSVSDHSFWSTDWQEPFVMRNHHMVLGEELFGSVAYGAV